MSRYHTTFKALKEKQEKATTQNNQKYPAKSKEY